jgi:hypothetical protein
MSKNNVDNDDDNATSTACRRCVHCGRPVQQLINKLGRSEYALQACVRHLASDSRLTDHLNKSLLTKSMSCSSRRPAQLQHLLRPLYRKRPTPRIHRPLAREEVRLSSFAV